MYLLVFCIYFCVYLSQTISRQPCIGIAWDLFRHATLAQEMQLEPVVATISRMVPPIPAALPVPRPVRRGQSGPFLTRVSPYCFFLLCMIGLQCGDPADSQVCVKLS